MSIQQTINYDTAGNFTFDSGKIEITGGKAQLKLTGSAGQTFTKDTFGDATFDSNKTEVSGSLVQQKDQKLTGSVLGAAFLTDATATWNDDGSPTGTLRGTPTFTGGKMVCTGSQGVYWNVNFNGVYTIRVKYTPNYTGNPPNEVNIVALYNGSNNNDRMTLTHSLSGTLKIYLANSSGFFVLNGSSLGSWSPTAGTEYEFEFNVNNTLSNTVKLYIDGALQGAPGISSWPNNSVSMRVVYGALSAAFDRAEGSFDDAVYFNSVQHTSPYTPGYSVAAVRYVEDLITLPAFVYGGLGNIQSFDSFSTTESNTASFNIDGQYWNGSAWVSSDDTLGQMNTAAVINTNIGSLGAVDSVVVKARMPGGASQKNIDLITLGYTDQAYSQLNPTIINNSGVTTDDLVAFSAVTTEAGSDLVKFVVQVAGQDKYWNGSAWANSNGTYAESNTEAEITTNINSLAVSALGELVKIKAFLHSDDGSTTPSITSALLTYDFSAGSPTEASETIIYGWLIDPQGNRRSGVSIKMTAEADIESNSMLVVQNQKTETITDVNGYFEISVVPGVYTIKVGTKTYTGKTVPSQVSANFIDIIP